MPHLNLKFDYPPIDRVTLPTGVRYYICPETGVKLPSVTTIISATSDKDFTEWEQRVGKKKADQERKYGTDLGSLVHDHMEKHLLNEERPKGSNLIRMEAKRMADSMITNLLSPITDIWGLETPLYYPALSAGTTDVVGLYNGIETIIDFKTAKKIRKRSEITDYAAQLGAYAIFHDEKYGTNISQGVVLMVSRELKCEAFIYNKSELLEGRESFLTKTDKFYSTFSGF